MSFHSVWVVGAMLLVAFFVALGGALKRRWDGILIDSRNKMSLSRLQIVLWTLILLSALFALALVERSLDIGLSSELLALMGISTGSTAGSVMVKSNKRRRDVLHVRSDPSEARWSDLFLGDEKGDHEYIDIGKVQMFFFTIAIVAGYLVVVWDHEFVRNPQGIFDFPSLSASMVTFLGISHTGYLTIKATPKG